MGIPISLYAPRIIMIADVRRLLGAIDVFEEKGIITIKGIPTFTFTKDVEKYWKTTRLNNNMFITLKRSEVTFYSFFAIEVEVMLSKLLDEGTIRTNRRALIKILSLLRTETWLKNREIEHPSPLDIKYLKEIKFELLPHQKTFLDHYINIKPRYNLRGTLLMTPAGGGKTISGISIAVCANPDYNIIVCPKNAVYDVWKKTLINDMVKPQDVWVAADNMPANVKFKWFIFHYEALDKALVLANKFKDKKCVILLDESHSLNEISSLRTDRFLQLCNIAKPTDVIWASGTPIKALGTEAIPLFRSIDPLFTPKVEERFKKIFNQDMSKANEILAHRLGIIAFKVPKSTFMTDKPIIEDRFVEIPNGDEYTLEAIRNKMGIYIRERIAFYNANMHEYVSVYEGCLRMHYEKTIKTDDEFLDYARYKDCVHRFRTKGVPYDGWAQDALFCNQFEKKVIIPKLPDSLKKPFTESKTVVKYVALKVRGECLGNVLSKERERCNTDMLKAVEFGDIIDNGLKKTVIFTSYVKVVDACFNTLTNDGYKPLRVYGDTNADLVNIIETFRKTTDVNPLIATYQSLSTAVPLIMANTMIMLNSPFRYHEQEQAIARCWRIGQDKPVYVYRYFLDTKGLPNISTRSEDIFEWSRQQVNQLLGMDISEETVASVENINIESLAIEDNDLKTKKYCMHPSAYW